jgi:hypothetical protein
MAKMRRGAPPARAGLAAFAVTVAVTVAVVDLAGPRAARGADVPAPPPNPFACLGEAQAVMKGLSTAEIRAERDRRLAAAPEPGEARAATAHKACVIAELMRRLGDDRAAATYQRALADSGGEPGYELRYADYLRNVRGPRAPLTEDAEGHFQGALEGVRGRRDAPSEADATVEEWSQRGLMLVYQQDGLPLLPWKAFPYANKITPRPGLSLMAGVRFAVDTNDVPVDLGSPAAVDDARRFTSEAMFSASAFRKAIPLRTDELQAIARAPRHQEVLARARVRPGPIGALDVWFRGDRVDGAQVTNFSFPRVTNDVRLAELGLGFSRALDLHPAFDFLLAGDYRRVHRTGVVEFLPNQAQDFNLFEVRPVIARFLGPDKLSIGATYVYMGIPDVVGGVIEDRARGRAIRAVNMDYAIYRPLLLPQLQLGTLALRRQDTRGLHLFAGAAQDDETFGIRRARRRDAYFGVGLLGIGDWDFTVQGSLFTGQVDVRPIDPRQFAGIDPQQTNGQYRTTLVVLRRLIDEDAMPGLPPGALGVRPSMVNAVLTVRHDARLSGLYAFQNVRGGLDVWAKAFATSLRGTAFLVSAGYENQYFYTIGKDLHIGHVDLRMGW